MTDSEEFMNTRLKFISIQTLFLLIFFTALPLTAVTVEESLSFTDTELYKVMEIFSVEGDMNIFIDEDVKNQKITFFAKKLSMKDSLNMIMATNSLQMKMAAKNTYLIYPKKKSDEYDEDKISHVFHLNNRDPKNILNIIKGISKKTKVFMNETINAVND